MFSSRDLSCFYNNEQETAQEAQADVCRSEVDDAGNPLPEDQLSPLMRRVRVLRRDGAKGAHPDLARLPGMYWADVIARVPNARFVFAGDSVITQFFAYTCCSLRHTGSSCKVRPALESQGASRTIQDDPNLTPWHAGNVYINEYGSLGMGLLTKTGRFTQLHATEMLELGDIIVFEYGLHYASPSMYMRHMDCLLRLIVPYAKLFDKLVIIADVPAQHFPNENGFGQYRGKVDGPCTCVPHTGGAFTREMPMNAILMDAIRRHNGEGHVRVLPYYNLTEPLHDWHFGARRDPGWPEGMVNCDCTHYCMLPPYERLFEVIAGFIDDKWPGGRDFSAIA